MTGKLQKYADASLYAVTRVIDAADRFYACTAEFSDDADCWGEAIQALDAALEACPGTNAHHHASRREQEKEMENGA